MEKSTITYKKDIIKNVAAKTGYTEEQVEYSYTFFFWMLKKLMARPDVCTITLPKFCTLYTALPMLRLKQKELQLARGFASKKQAYMKEELEATEAKIIFLEAEAARHSAKVWYGSYKKLVHTNLPMLSSKFFNKGYTRKQLEEFQNKD